MIPKGMPIIMIDVSLKMPDMLALAQHSGGQLTWIDHHISAINEYHDFMSKRETQTPFMTAVLEDGIAACELGWKYLFPGEEMPRVVKLLGEYDTWRNSDKNRWENEILPFQFGMRMDCNSPETFSDDLFEAKDIEISEIIYRGNTILKYQAQINYTQCRKAAFETNFEGLRAICLNGGGFSSDVFKSVYDENKHDIMMPFQFDGKQWIVSLYTTKANIDCSAIAKTKGGGGHAKAAGFQVEDISSVFPFIQNDVQSNN